MDGIWRPGAHNEIGGLPLHVYEAGGEKRLKPCAELLMTESDAEWILEQGLMPLVSSRTRMPFDCCDSSL